MKKLILTLVLRVNANAWEVNTQKDTHIVNILEEEM